MRIYTVNCHDFDVHHYEFWRFDISCFTKRCAHAPKSFRWAKLVQINMGSSNGSYCRTKRWWLYFKRSSWCIDYHPK